VTLTSDGPLPIAPWVQTAVEDDERVSWASLHWSGELNGNPLGDAGAIAFGLPASEHYAEVCAFATLVDADLDLDEIDRSASANTLCRPASRACRPGACTTSLSLGGTGIGKSEVSRIRGQLATVADSPHDTHRAIAGMLRDAKADLTAFADFPQGHWAKTLSTNPIERLNKELKRRTDVVGIFPNPAALLRMSSAVLIEHHDEWQDTDRRYLSEASVQLLLPTPPIPLAAPTRTRKRPAANAELATA
jgi:hypothetical protein